MPRPAFDVTGVTAGVRGLARARTGRRGEPMWVAAVAELVGSCGSCTAAAAAGRRDDVAPWESERGGAVASAERKPVRGIRSRESVMVEVMEMDEAQAGGFCLYVLITRSCTGFTVLNPAYQNPDRRGRAGATRGDRDDQDGEKVPFPRFVTFLVRRLGLPASRGAPGTLVEKAGTVETASLSILDRLV